MKKPPDSESEIRGRTLPLAKTINKTWPGAGKLRMKRTIERPVESEVAVGQRVALKEGKIKITTEFLNGDLYDRDVFTVAAPGGAVETALGAVDQHRMDFHDDLREFKADAERYARIKSRDRDSLYLSSKLIEIAINEYADMYKGAQRSGEDYTEGYDYSNMFPVLLPREKTEIFRKVLQENLDDRKITRKHKLNVGMPKLDDIERGVVDIETSLTYAIYTHAGANSPEHDEEEHHHEEADLAMLTAREGGREEVTQKSKFKDFTDKIIALVDRCNEAWFLAAEAVSKGEKLPFKDVKGWAEEIKILARAAKKDFAAYEEEVADPYFPNSWEIRQALENIDHSNNGSEGLFATVDKVVGILSREDLLKSTIEKGMTKEMGK